MDPVNKGILLFLILYKDDTGNLKRRVDCIWGGAGCDPGM